MSKLVSPSILSADFASLGREINMLDRSVADWIHLDIMDGVFVPNISFGLPVVRAVSKLTLKPLDVHLMIVNPEKYLGKFCSAGASILTVQYEACVHLHGIVQQIRSLGMKAGVALNPHTPVSSVENIIGDIDLLLIMSVNPGFGGQRFIPKSLDKVRQAKELIMRTDSSALIEVDGGISIENAEELYSAGADVLVAGNAVFSAESPADYIKELKVKS
ncbi:MAG: ribulose-phosphate 3-epimerase [Prevotellaceae bacterium]|jgi:ribulose-phosphate 3-epimerase|nr:ribulose-phosphate 3-epimerase [Prevotellaceae bacterium]